MMHNMKYLVVFLVLTGCALPEPAHKPDAIDMIRMAYLGLKRNCSFSYLPKEDLVLSAEHQEEADKLLTEIGAMTQKCVKYQKPIVEGCHPDCSWCPVKWYWCIDHAAACLGGDHTECCRLDACGSKSHCKEVCGLSCGCDVPPN